MPTSAHPPSTLGAGGVGVGAGSSGSRDDAQLGKPLPGQAQDQGVELRRCERQQRRRIGRAGPDEAPRVEPARRAPHAEAVVHQQLDTRAAGVREQVAMVRLRCAEDLHNARQQALGAGAHVDRVCGQPHRVDADHRSNSRIQAAHSLAALAGQVTVTAIGPRRSSMRTSGL